ncbi:MAG: hypothetical protein LBT15_03630 [Synergistaceae bacterium]|jgi:hypothetical protein|nr:hypothetical protein [Synergistaceae bacterium]
MDERFAHSVRRTSIFLFTALAVNLVIFLVPWFRYIAYTYTIVVHEFGHAACAWATGYLALPTFDIIRGGGITMMSNSRSLIMFVPVIFFLAFATYKWYVYRGTSGLWAAAALWIVYALFSFSGAMWRFLINSSGHASEILTGLVCIYFGFSTAKFNRPRHEKIILFTLGSHLLVNAVGFAISLNDAGFIRSYTESEKVHDFVKLSNAMGLSYSFFSVALLVLIALGVATDFWFLLGEDRMS